jgi:putative PIN family toxin of toxin-antitoxin system
MRRRYQVVMDTNVFLSALRSRRGASFKLLSLVGSERFGANLSVPLVLEYEQVAKRSQWPGKPPWRHIADILDYLCLVGRRRRIHFLWRPRKGDPKDDMVLEVAVAGGCDCIITYNKRDFADAPSLGLEVLSPKEFLKRIGEVE